MKQSFNKYFILILLSIFALESLQAQRSKKKKDDVVSEKESAKSFNELVKKRKKSKIKPYRNLYRIWKVSYIIIT